MRNTLLSALVMLLCNSLFAAVAIDSVTASPSGSVPKYAKLELLVALSGLSAQVKPYEAYHAAQAPNGVSLSATFTSGSASYTINGFWDGAAWRIRFAPDAVGTWDYTVSVTHAGGSAATGSASFTCVESELRGFARIGTAVDDRSVLRFSSGEASYLIGHNNGWQGHIENPTLPDMAARGENLLSFWLAMPWAKPSYNNPNDPQNNYWAARSGLEYLEVDGSDNVVAGGVGNYNQAFCQFMDGLVARAETSGVYLLPSVWSHGQLRLTGSHPWGQGWWVDNPYRKICAVTEFFKMTDAGADTPQWRQQKNHYRYLCARWGYSRMIAGWVGVVEIDGTTRFGFNPNDGTYSANINRTEVEAWCAAVRNEFAANDPLHKNSSGRHPLTYSRTDFDPDGGGPLTRSTGQWSGGADARSLDAYVYKTNNTEIGPDIATQTVNMRSFAQPGYHAEFGGEVVSGNKTARYPAHLHNGIWGGTAAGAALMPLQWCDGGQYPMLDDATVGADMRNHIETLARFMARVDYVGASGWGSASLSSVSGYRSWGMRVTDRGHAWILKTTGTVAANQTFNVASMPAGTYRIKWYDVWGAGTTPVHSTTVTLASAGNLALVTPALSRQDIAVQFGVNRAPVAAAQNLTTAEETALAITTTGSDADGDALTFALLSSPANGTLTGTLPNVTYTPNANFNGTDSFTFRVNDGLLNSATATVAINVTAVNDVPVASSNSVSVAEDGSVAVMAGATDNDGGALTFVLVAGPAHGTLTGTLPDVTYTPAANYNGADAFSFKANDGTADSNTATVSITVTAVNDAPVASDGSVSTDEDTSVAITAGASDIDSGALTFVLVSGPAHGTLTGTLPNVTYTPAANYNGADAFSFKANDGALDSNTATVSINVASVVDPTLLQSVTAAPNPALPNQAVAFAALAVTGDDPVLNYTWDFGDGSAVDVTTAADNSHAYASQGSFTASVTLLTVGGSSSTKQIVVTVDPNPNTPPVANDRNVALNEDANAAITVTATDANGGTLSYILVSAPAHGTLSGALPDVVYTPAADYSGPDAFSFKANDGAADSNVATVSITVAPVNDAPVALEDSVAATEDGSVAVFATATDIDSGTLSFVLVSGPTHGTLSGTLPGVTYTPDANYNGSDSFSFKANDGALDSNMATVSITVTPVNDAPAASDDSATVAEDGSTAVDVSASDIDGDALSYILVSGPANGTLSGSLPNVTYTPNANYNGADAFTFKANDGFVDSNVATVAITVAPVNDAPVASNNSATVAEDGSTAITVSASDIDGDALSYILISGPANGTLSGALPNVTYTPAANYNGADSFTFKANDGSADSNVAAVSITVTPVNDAPTLANLTASPDPGTANQTVTFSVTVSDLEGGAFSCLWNFGDGTTPVATSVNSVAHVFTQGGTFTVGVTVTDAGGLSAGLNRSFTVNAPPPPPTPVTVTFQDGVSGYAGTRDTFIRNNSNNGTATTLTCFGSTDHGVLMAWNISTIPAGSVVQSVSITLNVTTNSTSTYEIYALKRNWVESQANWSRYSTGNNWQTAGAQGVSDRDSIVLGTLNGSAKGNRETVLNAAGVAAVQAWVNNPSQNFGFTFQDYAAPNKLIFSSSEATTASQRPKLTITYVPAQ